MEEATTNGKMEEVIKDSISMIRNMVLELIPGQTEGSMWVNGPIVNDMVMVK